MSGWMIIEVRGTKPNSLRMTFSLQRADSMDKRILHASFYTRHCHCAEANEEIRHRLPA